MSDLSDGLPQAMGRLAGEGPCSVLRCPCGCIHVNVGPTTVRVSPDTLRELAKVLAEASLQMETAADVCRH